MMATEAEKHRGESGEARSKLRLIFRFFDTFRAAVCGKSEAKRLSTCRHEGMDDDPHDVEKNCLVSGVWTLGQGFLSNYLISLHKTSQINEEGKLEMQNWKTCVNCERFPHANKDPDSSNAGSDTHWVASFTFGKFTLRGFPSAKVVKDIFINMHNTHEGCLFIIHFQVFRVFKEDSF